MSREDGRSFAILLLGNDEPAAAKTVAQSLLVADPEDPIALILLSQAERILGNLVVARQAGQAAWAYAKTDDDRFAAATVTAQALTSEERLTRAQFWLRRARNFAPNDAMAETVARDYATLARLNPLRFQVQFGVAPSSNINNGSAVDSILFGGNVFTLNPSAQNLSGYEFSGAVNVDYRVQETERSRTTLGVTANVLRYALSDSSKTRAPDFDVSDRAYNRLDLSLRRDWAVNEGLFSAEFGLAASMLGDQRYTTETRIQAERIWLLSESTRLDGTVSLVNVNYSQIGSTSDVVSGTLNWRTVLDNDDSIRLGATFVRTSSDNAEIASDSTSVSASYNFGLIGENLTLSTGIGYQIREFEPSIFAPFGREDRKSNLNINLGFPQVEYYGFSPVLRLEGERTSSNIARYQTETVALDLSFQSSF